MKQSNDKYPDAKGGRRELMEECLRKQKCYYYGKNGPCSGYNDLGKCFKPKPEATKKQNLLRSDDTPGSATSLRELKTELIGYVRSFDLEDDQDLCISCQNLICGWIDLFFENKIYDEDIK